MKGVKNPKINYTLKRMLNQLVTAGYLVQSELQNTRITKREDRWRYILDDRCLEAKVTIRKHWASHAVFTLQFDQINHLLKKQHGYSTICASLIIKTLAEDGTLWSDSDDYYGCCLMELQPTKRESFYIPMTFRKV